MLKISKMTYPEAVFCEFQEYNDNEGSRLDAPYLNSGELYSIMFSLEDNKNNREAAKLPATVGEKIIESAGIYAVKLVIHDIDLKPAVETEGRFEDGFWLNVRDKVELKEHESQRPDEIYTPEKAYIMSYSDPMNELQAVKASKELLIPA